MLPPDPMRLSDIVSRAIETSVDPMIERIGVAEARLEMKTAEMAPVLAALHDLTKENAALRERMAVLETRAPEPGPTGKDGQNATTENIKMVRRSERVVEFCFKDGTPIEGGLIKLNHPVFNGPFVKEADYDEGDLVQWGSAVWIALKDKPSVTPGQGNKDMTGWQLFSKPGRDGKDLRPQDAPSLPVVKVR